MITGMLVSSILYPNFASFSILVFEPKATGKLHYK